MTDYYSHLGLRYHQRTDYKNSILERDNHTCQLCGTPAQEVDHIIPWAISRNSEPPNLRAICIKCNRATRRQRKDANPFKTLDEWYNYIKSELVYSASQEDG
jgi:5-methylcytosine-specific restriction endonuclease McrA